MSRRPSNTLRVIGGAWRGRLLRFPDAPGLRPTPDRARETLFNWLGQRLDGQVCLDAFAGSGALGFEAASRGAARVLMLDSDARVCDALRRNAQALDARQVDIERADALAWLARPGEAFDLIFLDPPFALDLLQPALAHAATRLRRGGKIYAESPAPLDAEGWRVTRHSRAGLSHYCLLEPA